MAAASVQIKSAKLWNDLDLNYKTITNRKNFRAKLKEDIINVYSDS